jgi:imidazolonepropionase-like amidohydrolase
LTLADWLYDEAMSFCEHCEGQRFDRAQVLRVLRATRRDLRTHNKQTDAEEALALAINAVRSLEVPHLELLEDFTDEVIH